MSPLDLLKTAEILLKAGDNRPIQANLRRAQSTIYYALFHTLAKTCADLLMGGTGAARSHVAWRQTYRALNHKPTKEACRKGQIVGKFPDAIRDFANTFVTMQAKRHLADYDSFTKFTKFEVAADVELARQAMTDCAQATVKHRRSCAYVLFKFHE